ncbi:MAG: amylo-alpha-1,6-glucosidase [Brachybacterium sp.]|nr:amylo-alpha-1,6-glucosidase [Brachybacterium sp.]
MDDAAARALDGAPSSPAAFPLPLSPARPVEHHQPFLHDLVGVFRAPVQAWSRPTGSIEGAGAQGVYIGDTRVVSGLRCAGERVALSPLGTEVRSARELTVRDVVSTPGDVTDPLLVLERTRTADASGIGERLRLVSHDHRPHRLVLRLGLLTDAASMSAVKDPGLLAEIGDIRPSARTDGAVARWDVGDAGGSARLDVGDGGTELVADGAIVTWTVVLETPPARSAVGEAAEGDATATAEASWHLALHDPAVPFTAASTPWSAAAATAEPMSTDPETRAADLLLRRSLADLDALRLQIPGSPSQTFFAAGAPWFFTLFGRDSLIAASLVLPLDRSIAEGTLRTLARRQGTAADVSTAEQPGKILHEVRAQGMEMGSTVLPPVYYGTIDATPLWIELLHEADAAGLPAEVLTELRPALEQAALWLLEHADADGDGLLEYLDEAGRGLANQGWKDSGDSIRFADGSLAGGAIALAEVQGYAYAAAGHAADLLERLGTGAEAEDAHSDAPAPAHAPAHAPAPAAAPAPAPAPDDLPARLRAWAHHLRERFHETFWCEDDLGPYVALALDGDKRPVDGVASNMGHLLGTGLLDPAQERIVVDRLLHPSLLSGYGIRTLSTTNGAYGPLRYHGGSVWTHDTACILRGMLRGGFTAEARVVARALLQAANGFDQRLPELFSGQSSEEVSPPVPYPASCRPQAWAAAGAIPVAQALGVLRRR